MNEIKVIMKRIVALGITMVFIASATTPFTFAEEAETSTVLEMQESYNSLPVYYNSMDEGYVTSIKQQKGYDCWAYATITSIETSLLKQGIAQDQTTLDLSEAQLEDAMFTRSDDPLHNTAGDMNFIKDVKSGFEPSWAAQIMASGLGPANEQDYYDCGSGNQFDPDMNVADFWSCVFIPPTREDLKRAVYQYGSVSIVSWEWWHAFALIGWDDYYEDWPLKYDDPVYVPGVFLVKDSDRSGAGEYISNYKIPYDDTEYIWEGDDVPDFWDGKQWPNFYDAVAYEYRDKDTYDNVYLYDGSGYSGEIEVEKAAAIFEAKAGTDTHVEQIVSATLPLASLDMTASVQIYTDLKDTRDPESGTPLFKPGSEPTIHADYSGMYSVDFTEFGKVVPLRQGELFSVVMTLPNGGSVITACDGEYFDCYNKENIEQGQTFFYGCNGKDGWTDGLELSHTARLHVQTKMIPISELPPSDVHEHNWSSEWEKDDTHHWYDCTDEDCPITTNADKDSYGEHTWNGWEKDRINHWHTCTVCGAELDKSGHAYDDDQDAICDTCGYKRTVTTQTPPPSSGSSNGSSSAVVPPTAHYTITATVSEGGRIDPGGEISIQAKKDLTFAIIPDDGYVVVDVLVDSKSVGAVDKYIFEKVSTDHTIRAEFKKDSPKKDDERPAWNPFVDVNSRNWFHDSVKYVYEQGLMVGTDGTHFSPRLDTSRAMIATTLWRLSGSPSPKNQAPYTDCSPNSWYSDAVAWADESGIVKGYGRGIFAPDKPITREEMAVMLWRYAGSPEANKSLDNYTDSSEVSRWSTDALCWAVDQGILTGRGGGILDPKGKAVRSEVAAMLQRYLTLEG